MTDCKSVYAGSIPTSASTIRKPRSPLGCGAFLMPAIFSSAQQPKGVGQCWRGLDQLRTGSWAFSLQAVGFSRGAPFVSSHEKKNLKGAAKVGCLPCACRAGRQLQPSVRPPVRLEALARRQGLRGLPYDDLVIPRWRSAFTFRAKTLASSVHTWSLVNGW